MATSPPDELERIGALERLDVLDADRPEPRFDRIARLAARAFDVPIAYVSVIDRDTQYLLSCVGVPLMDVPREGTFCTHTIERDTPLVVPDAARDPRWADNPYVAHLGARFYAGHAVRDPVTGHAIGTICLVDMQPRELADDDVALLADLARLVEIAEAVEAQRSETAAAAERLSTVLSSTAEAIVGMDRDGRVVFANAATTQMFGHTPDVLDGAVWHELVHGRDRDGAPVPWVASAEARTIVDGRVRRTTDDWYWRADGTGFPAETSVAPSRVDGHVTGVVVTVLDVTRQRSAELARRAFVANVSHELRTPLTSIFGSLGLLENGLAGEIDDEAREVVEIARSSTDRLVRLVTELLDLDQLQRGRLPVRFEPTDLGPLVDAAVDCVRGHAEHVGIELDVVRPEGITVVADADRIVQVLVNLLGNAIRYSDPGQIVTLGVEEEGRGVSVRVVDHGRGIPAAALGTIFEPFEQADPEDDRDRRGSGLGLSIARALVEAHGGRVHVDSKVGVGSTFHVWIPRSATPAPTPTDQGVSPEEDA